MTKVKPLGASWKVHVPKRPEHPTDYFDEENLVEPEDEEASSDDGNEEEDLHS